MDNLKLILMQFALDYMVIKPIAEYFIKVVIFDAILTSSLQEIAHLQRCLVCPPSKHLAYRFHRPAHLTRSLEILGLEKIKENLLTIYIVKTSG